MSGAGVLVISLGMLGAPAPEPPSFSPGIGFTVSRLQRDRPGLPPVLSTTPPKTGPGGEVNNESNTSVGRRPRLSPPPTDLARIQGSPRAVGIHAAAAVATQLAMIIAGVMSVQEQRRILRRERARQPAPFSPYPR